MNPRPFSISSVTRWLLVVAGCVVLETAQPAFAGAPEEPAPPPSTDESVIYPRGSHEVEPGLSSVDAVPDGSGYFTWVVGLGLVAAGGWFLWKKKQGGMLASAGRKIQIEETRAMGNRQYLVVAQCEGKRFLLGVTPGRIDVVSPLDARSEEAS